MLNKSKYYILLLFTILLFGGFYTPYNTVRHNVTFGVKIGILPTGDLTQYAIVHYRNGRKTNIQPVSLKEMLNVATGKWPVPGTNKFYDFFDEQGIYDLAKKDSINKEPIDYNAAFDSLWKIRYPEHPFKNIKDKGWSNGNARPSLDQQKFIFDTYGVRGYEQDYFTDTSFFKLLRDVLDPEWIANYKSL